MNANDSRWSTWMFRLTLAILLSAMLVGCAVPEPMENPAGGLSTGAPGPRQTLLKLVHGTVEIKTGATWSPVAMGGNPVVLEPGQHVRTGDLSSAQISLADGSQVDLDAKSELSIDILKPESAGLPRAVSLTQVSGQSLHTVAPAAGTGSRYEVHTSGGIATAKGTQFSVRVLPDQSTYLNVVEGEVVVISAQVTITIAAGQMTSFLPNRPPSPPLAYLKGNGLVTQTGETWIIAGLAYQARQGTTVIGTIQPGDLVIFEGHLLADGSRALDLVILLQPSPVNTFRVQGIVEKITATEWTVQGMTIQLTLNTWIETGIAAGSQVEVEGLLLTSGGFQAERILLTGEKNGAPFEFVGPVQVIGTDQWTIAGITIHLNSQTIVADGMKVGHLARVTGRIQSGGTWLAQTIQPAAEPGRQFEFTGAITSLAPWTVAGVTFETRTWSQIDPGLKVGDLVRVTGSVFQDGVWVAVEIRKLSNLETSLILVGPALSVKPWVVSGVTLKTTLQTVILGNINVGMLVRVEARLLDDGTWEAVRIEALHVFLWVPTCLNLRMVWVSSQGSLVQFQGWPQMTLPVDFKLPGELVPNQAVAVRMCFNAAFVAQITSITIIQTTTPAEESGTDRVIICHKPDKKKSGTTMVLPQSALGGHLGHGDTLGTCQ